MKCQQPLAKLEKITGSKLTLGNFIYSIRSGEELTQVAFAGMLGISKQQLCDIEHDRKIVSPQLAAEYADILGYSQKQFVRLALQAQLDRAGLHFNVDLKEAA